MSAITVTQGGVDDVILDEILDELELGDRNVLYISTDPRQTDLMLEQFLSQVELEITEVKGGGIGFQNGSHINFIDLPLPSRVTGLRSNLIVAHNPTDEVIRLIIAPLFSQEGTRSIVDCTEHPLPGYVGRLLPQSQNDN